MIKKERILSNFLRGNEFNFTRVYLTGLDGIKANKDVIIETDFYERAFEIRIINHQGKNFK